MQIDEQSLEFSRERPNKAVTEIVRYDSDRRKINTNYNYPYDCIVRLSFFKIVASV